MTGLEDVEPLFTPDMVVYYDRYFPGDSYEDPAYIRHFRTILKALKEGNSLCISYASRHQSQLKIAVTPQYLEYSEKDDRFRLVAAGEKRRYVLNLSRIQECTFARSCETFQLMEEERKILVFDLEDRRNALDRVLLHFSHLEKETKRLDHSHYRVTLKYDRTDRTEMVIRILSFGPVIKVTEPDDFVRLIRERIERQAGTQNLLLSRSSP